MKVLVAGANGHTGRLVVRYLKEKGHEPLALIRDEKQADALKELGAAPVIGDLEKDVTDAVKQADAVIFAAGSGSKTGADKTIAVDQEGAKRLVDTAKKKTSSILLCLVPIMQMIRTKEKDKEVWKLIMKQKEKPMST